MRTTAPLCQIPKPMRIERNSSDFTYKFSMSEIKKIIDSVGMYFQILIYYVMPTPI